MKHPVLLTAATVIALLGIVTSSCQKETDCKATIVCNDSLGRPVNGANVYLYAPVKSADGKTTYTADITASGNTDSDGRVNFTFKLPAIYDIKGTLPIGTRTISGTGVIKLEEGQTVEKTITLK
jgi:hypothetical protein